MVRETMPDLVILDLNLPNLGGLEVIRRLRAEAPGARILAFSMHTEAIYVTRALEAGALGYVSKNAAPDELLTAVQKVAEGGRYIEAEIAQEMALQNAPAPPSLQSLSERELEILRLLGRGHSLTEIAQSLGVAYKTVANTCTQIKAKLAVARTSDLIRLSIEMGIS